MAKKKKTAAGTISNKRAGFDYELDGGLVAGIALNGRETKALRLGHGQLRGSYVTVKNAELWLINATISGTNGVPLEESEQTRARKLLVSRKDIDKLIAAKQQGLQIIPTEILTKGRFIKLRIALGKSKKQYDKREVIKKRDDDRAKRQAMKRSIL